MRRPALAVLLLLVSCAHHAAPTPATDTDQGGRELVFQRTP